VLARGTTLPSLGTASARQFESEFPDAPDDSDLAGYQGIPAAAVPTTPVMQLTELSTFDDIDRAAAAREAAQPPSATATGTTMGGTLAGYSARLQQFLAPKAKQAGGADGLAIGTRQFTEDDSPSAYARVKGYRERHPRRCCAIICAALCCIGLIVVVAVVVAVLLPIADSTLVEGTTVSEIFDACDPNAIPFQVNSVMFNPGGIGGQMQEFGLSFDVDGKRLATAQMPGFDFGTGENPIALKGTLQVTDELALADTMNRFFADVPLIVDVVADVTVKVLGIPISTQLNVPVFLNTTEEEKAQQREQGGRAKLKSLKVTDSSTQVLSALVQMLFNQTSKQIVIALPDVAVDIYHLDARVANATVLKNRLAFGLNPWTVTANINAANVTQSGQLAGSFINDAAFDVLLRGAEFADRSCFLQRMLTDHIRIAIPFFEKKVKTPSALALERLALTDIGRRNIDLTLDMATTLGFEVEGSIPPFAMEVLRDNVTMLAAIEVGAFPFMTTKASAPISIVIAQPRATFDAGFDAFQNKKLSALVRGRSGAGATVFERVLNALQFVLTINDEMQTAMMSTTDIVLKKLLLLDANATALRARIDVELPELFEFDVVADVRGIFVEVLHSTGAIAARLRFDVNANLPTSFSTLLVADVPDPRATAAFASDVIDGKLSRVRLRGRPQFENIVGEMLQFLDTAFELGSFNTSAGGASSSFSFDAVDVGTFEAQSVGVVAKLRLDESLRLETDVPLPTAVIAVSRGAAELIRAGFQIDVLNNVVTARLNVTVTDAPRSGQLVGDLINAGPTDKVEIFVSGVAGQGNVIGTVLSHMRFNVTLADGMPPNVTERVQNAQDAISIDRLDLVSGLNYRARFEVAMTLVGNVVNVAVPPVEVEVGIGSVARVFVFGLEEFALRRGATSAKVKFYISAPSQADVNAGLNLLLGEKAPNIVLRGAAASTVVAAPTNNLLQRVLAQFRTNFALTDDKKPTTTVVDNGVLPSFTITVKDSSPNVLTVSLGLPIDMPSFVSFPISLGDVKAEITTQNAVIVMVDKPNLRFGPGRNNLTLDVTLTAANSRAAMETAASALALGTGFAATLTGSLGGASVQPPVGLRYDFVIPPDAAGGDSSFVECVEVGKMEIAGLSAIVGGTCSVDLDFKAFMRNPLPFAIVLNTLFYRAEMDDRDGALCAFGACVFSPKNDVLIGVVDVRATGGGGGKLPIKLGPSMTIPVDQFLDGSTAGGQGSWNEVCARLGSAFILNNDLFLDVEQGKANLNIEKVSRETSFGVCSRVSFSVFAVCHQHQFRDQAPVHRQEREATVRCAHCREETAQDGKADKVVEETTRSDDCSVVVVVVVRGRVDVAVAAHVCQRERDDGHVDVHHRQRGVCALAWLDRRNVSAEDSLHQSASERDHVGARRPHVLQARAVRRTLGVHDTPRRQRAQSRLDHGDRRAIQRRSKSSASDLRFDRRSRLTFRPDFLSAADWH